MADYKAVAALRRQLINERETARDYSKQLRTLAKSHPERDWEPDKKAARIKITRLTYSIETLDRAAERLYGAAKLMNLVDDLRDRECAAEQ